MNNQQIAKAIKQDYVDGRYTRLADGRVEFYVARAFTVRCQDSLDAVFALAKRFERGLADGGKTQPWPVRPGRPAPRVCSITTFLEFWESGEYSNALQYLQLFPREKWPTRAVEILKETEA